MKNLYIPIFFLLLCSPLIAQDFVSRNDYLGNWMSPATWEGGSVPGNTGGASGIIHVYGKVTLDDDLILNNNVQIEVYDTLWVKADIYINNGSLLKIRENAVLIVNGKLIVEEGGAFYNNGLTVIQESYDIRKGSFVSETKIYIYNNGPFNPGSEPIKFSGGIGTETDFINDYKDLYDQIATGTLPIKLLSFTATPQTSSIALDWVTAWEDNFDFFTVERAGSDLQFKAIGTVKGNGNTMTEVAYGFTDKNPLQGQAFYRLKATDYDGSTEHHEIISVHFNGLGARISTTNVYPNPVTHHSLKVETSDDSVSAVSLLDLSGHILYTQAAQSGINEIYLPETIKPGAYLLIVLGNQGKKHQQKIMVL